MSHACRHVLVVDDDDALREVIAFSLEMESIEVVSARGGAEAISALNGGFRPSVILLDLLMPDISGERLVPLLRAHPSACEAPIIAMSASPERLALVEGPAARLPKPFDLDALYGTMERLCRVPVTGEGAGGPTLAPDGEGQR